KKQNSNNYCCSVQSVQFQFNNKLCWQTNGMSMGSPVAPYPGDIFMAYLERTCLNSAIEETTYYR
ncbi:unnamed protein product, partial [Heterobilharzia americana]